MKSVHQLLFRRKYYSFRRLSVALSLLLGLLGLFGCGSSAISALPTPMGATSGLNTFIFLYTDT